MEINAVDSYRDTKVTVTMEVPRRDGTVTLCEIAIVTPEMASATVTEHPVYEIVRSTTEDRRASIAKLRKPYGCLAAGLTVCYSTK